MTGQPGRPREVVRRPLPLAYHPLYRFYEGGSMTRAFRGLPGRPDDRWSEDWVGSCTRASNDDPDGRAQGLSQVGLPGGGTITLKALVGALPEEMVGARFAGRFSIAIVASGAGSIEGEFGARLLAEHRELL